MILQRSGFCLRDRVKFYIELVVLLVFTRVNCKFMMLKVYFDYDFFFQWQVRGFINSREKKKKTSLPQFTSGHFTKVPTSQKKNLQEFPYTLSKTFGRVTLCPKPEPCIQVAEGDKSQTLTFINHKTHHTSPHGE